MSERYGFNRALCRAAAAQAAAFRVHVRGMLAESRHFERDDPGGAGGNAAAAATAAAFVDAGGLVQSPRSSCCHVNSGFVCLREKG